MTEAEWTVLQTRISGVVEATALMPRVRPPALVKPRPVSGPMEVTLVAYGHCPSKKNAWQRGRAGEMFLDSEVKGQIDTITTQLLFAWKYSGPVEHPEITMTFYVSAQRQDQDGMFTTVLDCMQAAGILVNDNIKHNNGRKILEPCQFVAERHERVEIAIQVRTV